MFFFGNWIITMGFIILRLCMTCSFTIQHKDVTASYGKPIDFLKVSFEEFPCIIDRHDELPWSIIYIKLSHYMCLINVHFFKSTCQIWLHVMKLSLSWRSLKIQHFMSEVLHLHRTFTDCVSDYYYSYNLVYRYARCDCRLSKTIWFECVCMEIFKFYYMFEML